MLKFQNHLLNIRACKVFLKSAKAKVLKDSEVLAVLAVLGTAGGGGVETSAAGPSSLVEAATTHSGTSGGASTSSSGSNDAVSGKRKSSVVSGRSPSAIAEAEAKVQALLERCRELERDNAQAIAKERVYLPYITGQHECYYATTIHIQSSLTSAECSERRSLIL